jgi:hypothetical protein
MCPASWKMNLAVEGPCVEEHLMSTPDKGLCYDKGKSHDKGLCHDKGQCHDKVCVCVCVCGKYDGYVNAGCSQSEA